MRRVPPSVLVHEELEGLLKGGADEGTNIVSALVEKLPKVVVQELLEAEQADFLGGRGRYERRGQGQRGSRNGYEPGRIRTAEGVVEVRVPQVRGAGEPYRSTLMGFLEGNSEVLERLVAEMYARGLSTRDAGRLQGRHRRAAHLQVGCLRDDRPALGGLPGLRLPGPLLSRWPTSSWTPSSSLSGPRGPKKPCSALVHRLGREEAPAAAGCRQQRARGLLDRVLAPHGQKRPEGAHHCHFRRRPRPHKSY